MTTHGLRTLGPLVLLCAWTVTSVRLPAQEAPPLAFEAVSIKQNTNPPGAGTTGLSTQPGRFVATNIPLSLIVQLALTAGVPNLRLEGAQAWLSTERYDIVATTGGPKTGPETMEMLRTMLADRFKLVTHRETKPAQVYHLVLARSDGRLGRDLKPSTLDCETVMRERSAKLAAQLQEAQKDGQASSAAQRQAITQMLQGKPGEPCSPIGLSQSGAGTTIKLDGNSMATLATRLRTFAGQEVIDRTGLAGLYDVTLRFQIDMAQLARGIGAAGGILGVPPGLPPALSAAAPPGDEAPPLAAALQEQLGLRLEAHDSTAEVMVIDRIEKPVDD